MDDDRFDADGILREEAAGRASPARSYRVFLQRFDARFEVAALEQQAARFFPAKLGIMAPKRYRAAAPIVDLARFAIARAGDASLAEAGAAPPAAVRAVMLRPATTEDHDHAMKAELHRQATGLGGLARRCQTVAEIERTANDDAPALLLAAIFASTHLGPIVDVEADDIFGVKTARRRLEGLHST
jgi:hypothetical protein